MYNIEDQFKLIADPTKCIKPKQKAEHKDKLYIEKFLYYKYKLTHDTLPNEIITTILSEIDKIIQNYQLQQFVSQFVDTCIHNAIEKLKFDIFIEELS